MPNKSPKDESFVIASEGREKNSFVLWEVGIAGSSRFRRMRMKYDIEFVLLVRLE
jgi:hypothetical protein